MVKPVSIEDNGRISKTTSKIKALILRKKSF
jgi:hypothetical protein